MTKPTRIIRHREVLQRVGLSRVTLWGLRQSGQFPKPLLLGKSAIGWREQDIEDWIASRPEIAA